MRGIYSWQRYICLYSCLAVCLYCNARAHRFQSTLGHLKPQLSSDIQQTAVKALIQRILLNRSDDFLVEINANFTQNGKEAFKLTKIDNKIRIIGTTGVVAATGFHYYLKYYCNAHISWELSQLNLAVILPDVDMTISLNDRFRYYENVCTTSYSFVWWNWEQWEKHIDWIALNSFNFVLAFNGQEAIWKKVFTKLGIKQKDIDEHFSGPAFLSWLRMGNIRGWGGPLSRAWNERSLFLQRKIIQRMREFGIITILPAFAGHVPRAFARLYPNTSMTKIGAWNNFPDRYCCPYFIDPTDEFFQKIGKMFIEEQISEYGTDHVYNCDSFNEMDPANDSLTYLSDVGKGIFNAMKSADSNAVWVMQGWLFVHSFFYWTPDKAKALLTSVPKKFLKMGVALGFNSKFKFLGPVRSCAHHSSKMQPVPEPGRNRQFSRSKVTVPQAERVRTKGEMIVLDLQSEQFPQFTRLDQYFGQPYIWCMLHNFGGTLGMHGSAGIINTDVIKSRMAVNSTMIGTGLTMEGINQNYVIYDFMTEQAWRNVSVDLAEWFRNYSRRRYGKQDNNAEEAWEGFKDTLYNFTGIERLRGQFAITKTPSLNIKIWTWYKYADFFAAWRTFIKAADNLKESPGYLHDLVDLTRQVLQNNGDIYYNKLVAAFKERNISEFQKLATIFRGIFLDLESILATNEAFLLGKWLEDAKRCANSTIEEKLLEFNARNQITLWGPWGEIMNYAIKQWSGIAKDFLYPRWDEFVYALNFSLVYDTKFNQALEQGLIFLLYEEPFVFARKSYPTQPKGSSIEIAKTIEGRNWYTNSDDIPENLKAIPATRKLPKKYKKVKRCNRHSGLQIQRVRRSVSKIRDLDRLKDYFSK